MRSTLCWILTAMLFSPNVFAQVVAQEHISIGTKITIASEVLAENRDVMVYTPDTIEPKQQYQVVYLLDAEYFIYLNSPVS